MSILNFSYLIFSQLSAPKLNIFAKTIKKIAKIIVIFKKKNFKKFIIYNIWKFEKNINYINKKKI